MACSSCGDAVAPKCDKNFTETVVKINNPSKIILFRKVVIPASMGDETTLPPTVGKYRNVLLEYEATEALYLYSSDGIPTQISVDVSELMHRINELGIEIHVEKEERIAGDKDLSDRIDSLSSSLSDEAEARERADAVLQDNIDAEARTRKDADDGLSADIVAEAQARVDADEVLDGKIDDVADDLSDEVRDRRDADNDLQSQIDAVVASSDVKDIVGTHAELENYDTSTLGNNDIIKVLQDETQNDATTYYRWSTQAQAFSLIGTEGPYYTKSQTNVLLDEKQDTLTAGTNIQISHNVISATDTTYTAGDAITIENNEISADIHPADYFTAGATVSGSGKTISLDNTTKLPLNDVVLRGDTAQQAYSGKNLIPTSAYNADENRSLSIPTLVLSAGTYTASFNIDSFALGTNTEFPFRLSLRESDNTGHNIVLQTVNSSTTTGAKIVTFTITYDAVASDGTVLIIPQTNYDAGGRIKISNLQIESGNQATSFEPYVGGIPAPNPDYPQEVQAVTGRQIVSVYSKNKLSIAGAFAPGANGTTGGRFTITKGEDTINWKCNPEIDPTGNGGGIVFDNVNVESGKKYVLSFTLDKAMPIGNIRLCNNYDYNHNYQSLTEGSTSTVVGPSVTYTFTANNNYNQLRIYLWSHYHASAVNNFGTISNPMLEEGTSATAYERNQSTEINLGKNLFDKDTAPAKTSNCVVTATATGLKVKTTRTSTSSTSAWDFAIFPVIKADDYIEKTITFSVGDIIESAADNKRWKVIRCDANGENVDTIYEYTLANKNRSYTITASDSGMYIGIAFYAIAGTTSPAGTYVIYNDIQMEVGNIFTGYSPYINPIKLYKIGDNEDKIKKYNGKWYVRKETNSKILSGDAAWSNQHSEGIGGFALSRANTIFPDLKLGAQSMQSFCDYFTFDRTNHAWLGDGMCGFNNSGTFWFQNADYDNDLNGVKAWLNSVKPMVYYPTEIATETEIVDQTLLSQLDKLASFLGYDSTTDITITSKDDLTGYLTVTASRNSLAGTYAALESAAEPTAVADIETGRGLKKDGNVISVDEDEIPNVNNGTLTIKNNGSTLQTFTANSENSKSVDIVATYRKVINFEGHDFGKLVIALCEVSTTAETTLSSYSIGKITLHRHNGLNGTSQLNIGIENDWSPEKSVNVFYYSNMRKVGQSEAISNTLTGWRPCVFKYNNKWYGGVEIYPDNASKDQIAFNGETNFNIFGVWYYTMQHGSTAAVIDNQEIYNSIDFTRYTFTEPKMQFQQLDVQNGTISKGYGAYTLTMPDKTGTIAVLGDIPTVDTNLSASSSNPLKNSTVTRLTKKVVQTGSTTIPANADLQTTAYLSVGTYYCSGSGTAASLLNCPTQRAFNMVVEAPVQADFDNESTSTYVYRVRTITNLRGEQWVQHVNSNDVAGTFSYGGWQRITTDSKLIVTKDNLSPTADTQAGWEALLGSEDSSGVSKTDKGYYVTYYNTANCFTNQPSSYGFLETFFYPNKNLYQRWKTLAGGREYYRSSNASKWYDANESGVFTPKARGDQDAWYGTSSTAASTADKVATISGYILTSGTRVSIKFSNGNTNGDPITLNVSGTGAKAIVRDSTSSTNIGYLWRAGEVVDFVYDGTSYEIVNRTKASTSYYGLTKLSTSTSSTASDVAATPSAVKSAYDLATSKAKITMTNTDPGEGASIGDNEFIAVYV